MDPLPSPADAPKARCLTRCPQAAGTSGSKAAGCPFPCRGRRRPLGAQAGGATHHDGEHEGDDVDGIGGTEAGEDAEDQVVLGPRRRRLVGQFILDVGLGAVLQSPLDVGAGGERGHGAAVRRAGGAESPALRAGGTERRRAKGAAPGRGRAGRGGLPRGLSAGLDSGAALGRAASPTPPAEVPSQRRGVPALLLPGPGSAPGAAAARPGRKTCGWSGPLGTSSAPAVKGLKPSLHGPREN